MSLRFDPKGPIENNPVLPIRRQAISWTNADTVLWRIYAALGVMSQLYIFHFMESYGTS